MTDLDPIEARTDEELAREARAGSRRSFEVLAHRYKRRLFVYLRSRTGSAEDAEDLVQDTFLKLFRGIGGYDPARRFSTWLYTAAGRLAIDAYRKGKAGRNRLAIDDIKDPSAGPEVDPGQSGGTALWDAARTLGGDRFRALWLRYGEDLTIEEIAAVLGRTGVAVRILLYRARTELGRRLGPARRPFAPGAASRASTRL